MQEKTALTYPDCDLREHPPRGAREKLAGVYFLARTVDKVRAKLQGTLGLYKVTPGFSGYMFESLGITEEQFEEVVRNAKDDAEIATWIERTVPPDKIEATNEMLVNRRLRDEEHRASFIPRYPVLEERPELWNWFEIFDVDDRWIFDPANAHKQ